jgi:hypothetical protein
MTEEPELDAARRTVLEAEAKVTQQYGIVEVLRRNGFVGGRADEMLKTFRAELDAARERLARLLSVQ